MITDRIRRIRYRCQVLWQHNGRMDWELEPAKFIRHLLRSRGFNAQEAARVMREKQPIDVTPTPILSRLVYRGETVAYRALTWIGRRYATEQHATKWLRWCGFSVDEVRSIFAIADTLPIAASEVPSVRALAASGIH